MHRFHFLLLSALLCSTLAIAQPTYKLGLRGGANRATTTLDAASSGANGSYTYSANKSGLYAWQGGVVLDIAVRNLSIQPALLFSQKGEIFRTQMLMSGVAGTNILDSRRTSRSNWLELPMNAVYTVHGFQVFGGPYVALAVRGRAHGVSKFTSSAPIVGPAESAYGSRIYYGAKTENRRLDAGLNFGVGYQRGPLQVQLGYGVGLRNLHQQPDIYIIGENPDYIWFETHAAYNRVVQLTGTYFFEL